MVDPFWLAAGTFAFTVIGTAITTTWRVGRTLDARDGALVKLMADHELSDVQRFAAVRTEISENCETIRHDFGETGIALRQKMHEMEMWGRDNHLQKRTFEIVTSEIKDSLKSITDKVDAQMIRDARVDRGRGT